MPRQTEYARRLAAARRRLRERENIEVERALLMDPDGPACLNDIELWMKFIGRVKGTATSSSSYRNLSAPVPEDEEI